MKQINANRILHIISIILAAMFIIQISMIGKHMFIISIVLIFIAITIRYVIRKKFMYSIYSLLIMTGAILFATFEYREFYSIEGMEITFLQSNKYCYVIPGRYYRLSPPNDNFLKIPKNVDIEFYTKGIDSLAVFINKDYENCKDIVCKLKKCECYVQQVTDKNGELYTDENYQHPDKPYWEKYEEYLHHNLRVWISTETFNSFVIYVEFIPEITSRKVVF